MANSENQHVWFFIDWIDFRRMLREAILDNETPTVFKNSSVAETFMRDVTASGSWRDFSANELKRWISEGYQPSMTIAVPVLPPMQAKRRMRYMDDGDDFHADRAIGGEEFFQSSMTYRKAMPAVSIEAQIMFSGATHGRVVNEYTIWLAQVCYSLESAGISPELSIDFPTWNCMGNSHLRANTGHCYHHVVRVKKASEQTGFNAWSPMVSPAALRNFGFGLIDLHADALNKKPSSTKGRGMPANQWSVKYDNERKVLLIENEYSGPHSFPEARMTEMFIEALEVLKNSQ